jgi:hypothetical protein
MKSRSKIIVLEILRREFDKTSAKDVAKGIVESAVYLFGETDDVVSEMISDYEFEYKEKYNEVS